MTARHRPRFRLYMAISLDGFVASRDGSVRWLEPYDAYEAGFGEFLATVRSIVMGRKSYEQMLGFGPWPYADKHTVVMTRIALRPATPDTEVSAEPIEMLADRLSEQTTGGDVWVFGGGEVARAFLAAPPSRHARALRGADPDWRRHRAVRAGYAAKQFAADHLATLRQRAGAARL